MKSDIETGSLTGTAKLRALAGAIPLPTPASSFLEVLPSIPDRLRRLQELAGNLFFGWHRPTRALFEDLHPELWNQTGGNPRLLLRCVPQDVLERAAADRAYTARYDEVLAAFDAYLAASLEATSAPQVAYFCAEYGFHESFPIYSGGLGILAGDYCKAASDERMNFVAVGLMYQQGYFTQTVDSDGVQGATYKEHDPRDLPVELVRNAKREPLTISVRVATRDVLARIWRARVGRVAVYLLDTNCPENAPTDRDITHRLYGGDESMRIRQEMILGIGGVRALRALGIAPEIWHINEGHAAFLILELLHEYVKSGLDNATALELAAAQCVFTTHTPVAAGHDRFGHELLIAHFEDFIRELGLPLDKFLDLGRPPSAPFEFNMTRLALNGARRVNGVSRIHGSVSAQLCADQWPELPPAQNPMAYVTNGVHVPTFLAQPWQRFFDKSLGAAWRERISDEGFWRALERVPDERFWRVSQEVKARMLAGVRERLHREYARKGLSPAQLRHVVRYIDPTKPDVLTVGFARRFATYKRASLLMRDRARLAALLADAQRPILFLFAGKAHPADEPGKAVLREIKQLMLTPELIGRIVFLEDYDIQLARWLVAGCDVWLNNPIAPLEASGTSGIKAAVNGSLNLSVLDGWWAEGFDRDNGWGIAPAFVQDQARRDALEVDQIYDTLEDEALPLYYARNGEGYSAEWVRRSKRAMLTAIPRFNMRRVVCDYAAGMYQPAARQHALLRAHEFAGARTLAQWKAKVRAAWPQVQIRELAAPARELPRSESLRLRVAVALNGLQPADVAVEFVARRELPARNMELPALASFRGGVPDGIWSVRLDATGETEADGAAVFAFDANALECGQFGTEIRVYPTHELLAHPLELGLLKSL
ncbi:MAG: alpha-glucan family phosphorylase [Steroidobacteraceae bacterium]